MFYKGGKLAPASPNTDLHGFGDEIRGELRKRIPQDEALKVLDVGTGFGINVAFLARWLSRKSSIWTVDPSESVLEEVKKMVGAEGPRVRFVKASADELGFDDGRFDVVVSVMVLHHLERIQPALKEMTRVLRPGGRLVLVDYLPRAGRDLDFATRHKESDFFTPAGVVKGLSRLGLAAKAKGFPLWYLVEAEKSRAKVGRGR